MDFLNRPLEQYVRFRLGPQASLERVERQTRGSSRATWFVTVRASPGAAPQTLVLRSDLPGGSTIPTSLKREYLIYERLGRSDVPVAKTLWWEDDPHWTESPFYVREHIDGSWEVPGFFNPDPTFDELRIETSKEHLRKLAIVHNVDWRRLGLDRVLSAPPDAARCAAHFIDGIGAQMQGFAREPIPLLCEAIRWLKERAPVAPRICLCKGTNGSGEEVFRNGVIVAMSDWEEASLGDPAADFAYLQDFMPELRRDGKTLWGAAQALEYYRKESGIELTLEAVNYYRIVRALSTVSFGHKAAVVTHKGCGATIRQAWTGTEVLYLGKRGLAAAMGLAPPLPPAWYAELNETVE